MNTKPRLLERIRSCDPNCRKSLLDDEKRSIESVKGNIQSILNTRQGSAIIEEGIGIPDLSGMNMNMSAGSRYELEQQIAKVIRQFEPRLGSVKVSLEGIRDPIEGLHFRLEGVVDGEKPYSVDFDTIINGDGKIYLRDLHS